MECVVCGAPSPPHDCSRTTLRKSHHVVGNLSRGSLPMWTASFQLRHAGVAFPCGAELDQAAAHLRSRSCPLAADMVASVTLG